MLSEKISAERTANASQDDGLRERYGQVFFARNRVTSSASAHEVLPLLLEFIKPRSVVDVGCGAGGWLAEFLRLGISDVIGMDGYVVREELLIPEANFVAWDLRRPLRIERKFDLATCLEVAEHLPEECARVLVESLTGAAPVVLFSAAIPFQGGTHLNEQWPDYWAGLFLDRGFVAVDALRRKIWRNDRVAPWYRQNILIFAERKALDEHPLLRAEYERTSASALCVVHPSVYVGVITEAKRDRGFRHNLAMAWSSGKRAVRRRLRL